MGYGNLINNTRPQKSMMRSGVGQREAMSLQKEKDDELKASSFTFKIVLFKTDRVSRPEDIPRKMTF